MATINTAEHFGLSSQVGQIAPGRWADILLVKDLDDFQASLVIARGTPLAEGGKLLIEMPRPAYPAWATHSVRLKRPVKSADFQLRNAGGTPVDGQVMANVIGIVENQAPTRHLRMTLRLAGGQIQAEPGTSLAKVAIVERLHASGRVMPGLVTGFGLTGSCAIASSVAHDCHHIVVIGTQDAEMALAVNTLAEMGGGQVVVKDGKVIGRVELPVAGLMSGETAALVARNAESILQGFRLCGCRIHNPNMQLSLLALPVIPELRLTDLGLVDVVNFGFIPVIEGSVE
jgi:adenine deaminase